MQNFKNQIVWITGASSGIGEALVYAFAAAGAKVVLSARRKEELERVFKTSGLSGENALILPLDVENASTFDDAVKSILAKFGQIDVLINNAGISQRAATIDCSMDVYRRLFEINFFGVVALTKAVLPHFLERKKGHFVITSSVMGKLGTPKRTGYASSKHALHGFFDSLRAEIWQDNVLVTLVCPGYIKTNISLNALNANGQKHARMDGNQEQGLDADYCAAKILNAIANKKEEVYIGGARERLGLYLKRFLPTVLSKMVKQEMPK